MKTPKKRITNNASIDNAEKTLDIRYPKIIREKLKEQNGFEWGGFDFFPVCDEDDKQHTFDDVVRENNNPDAGWSLHIPVEYVCIASHDLECLLLNKNKDGKIYYYLTGHDVIEEVFEDATSLADILDENDLSIKLGSPADKKYFIKLMLYSVLNQKQFVLIFHKQPELKNTRSGLVYCSKVNPSQRLQEVLKKEVKQITGSEDPYVLEKVYGDGTGKDSHGNDVVRYGLVIRVSYFKTQGKRLKDLENAYMSWVDRTKLD